MMVTRTVREDCINGNPNRQGGIAVHGQSSIRALCVIPTLNKPLCPRQLRLMKSAINPLLPRLHVGLPLCLTPLNFAKHL